MKYQGSQANSKDSLNIVNFYTPSANQYNIVVGFIFKDMHLEAGRYKRVPNLFSMPHSKSGAHRGLINVFYGDYCALQEYEHLKTDVEEIIKNNGGKDNLKNTPSAERAILEAKYERIKFLEKEYKIKDSDVQMAEKQIVFKKEEMIKNISHLINELIKTSNSDTCKVKFKIDGHGVAMWPFVSNENPKSSRIASTKDIKGIIQDIIKEVKAKNPDTIFELTLLFCDAASTEQALQDTNKASRIKISNMQKEPYRDSVASQIIKDLNDISKFKASTGANYSNNFLKMDAEHKIIATR